MPEWTCARCESAATAADRRLLEAMGWKFAEPAGRDAGAEAAAQGVCPVCAKTEREGGGAG